MFFSFLFSTNFFVSQLCLFLFFFEFQVLLNLSRIAKFDALIWTLNGKSPFDIPREEEVSFFETILFIWLKPLVPSVPNLYPLKNTFSIYCTDDVGKVWFSLFHGNLIGLNSVELLGMVLYFFPQFWERPILKKYSDHSGVIQNIKKRLLVFFWVRKDCVKILKLLTFSMNFSNPNALGLPLPFSWSSNLTNTEKISK